MLGQECGIQKVETWTDNYSKSQIIFVPQIFGVQEPRGWLNCYSVFEYPQLKKSYHRESLKKLFENKGIIPKKYSVPIKGMCQNTCETQVCEPNCLLPIEYPEHYIYPRNSIVFLASYVIGKITMKSNLVPGQSDRMCHYQFLLHKAFCLNITFTKILLFGPGTLTQPNRTSLQIKDDSGLTGVHCYSKQHHIYTECEQETKTSRKYFQGKHSSFSWFSTFDNVEIFISGFCTYHRQSYSIELLFQVVSVNLITNVDIENESLRNMIFVYKIFQRRNTVTIFELTVEKDSEICFQHNKTSLKVLGLI